MTKLKVGPCLEFDAAMLRPSWEFVCFCLATLRFLFQQSSYTNDGEIPPVQAGGAQQQGGRQGQWVARLSFSERADQLARMQHMFMFFLLHNWEWT